MQYQHAPAEAQVAVTPPKRGYVSDLDTPLLMFSAEDIWDLRSACTGVFVTGQMGSGKSSGAGATIFKSYLTAGFGGIVCCGTVEEVDRWKRYCAETGRTQSLVIVDKSLQHCFNFIDYQMTVGRGSTFQAVNVLLEILAAAEGRFDMGVGGKDAFWETVTRQLLSMSVAPLWAAHGRITLAELMKFIHSRPLNAAQLDPEGHYVNTSFWGQTMQLAIAGGAHPLATEDYLPVWNYWTNESEMMAPDQRTVANIIKTVTGKLDPFLIGDLRKLFATDTTYVPELAIYSGAVIVLDLSAHSWGQEGIFAQHIVKTMWMKAMQRRPKTDGMRPSFLAADECQLFMSALDQEFASNARSCRALMVYMTQNVSGVYAKIGSHLKETANALLANLVTKIAHAQSDPVTTEWLSNQIGKTKVYRSNFSENESEQTSSSATSGPQASSSTTRGGGSGISHGVTETNDYRLQPSHFTTLRMGGGPDRLTEAIVFQPGHLFTHTGALWTPVLFRQS